ncbi:MAG TPA: DMT family transporter [Jatrophihabitantaceae bacterium]|nr:DMT family transporter [Jatrophihabitantaceae bacterium]
MSLIVAVPCGLVAAAAYGAATAVQHEAAHTGTGAADARGLVRLLRDPRWLLSIGGDSIGLVFQVIALSTGPVVLIQPLLVAALPVSLLVGWALGGSRPRRAEYVACLGILGGLAVFFALIGDPGKASLLAAHPATVAIVVALGVGIAACLAVRGRTVPVRAAVYGGVAGAWFGLVGVLLNAAATTWRDRGLAGFAHAEGLVPLIGLLVIGALGITLTQISFQVGALGASFPANKATDPVVAVVLGAALLHEHVPAGPLYVVGYLACLAAIVAGTITLANPPTVAAVHQDT